MVDRYLDRCRSLRAGLAVCAIVAALGQSQLAAQAPDFPDSPASAQPPELPSKSAPPPRTRLASRQPPPSGDAPVPPGLMNNPPRLDTLPYNRPAPPGLTGLTGKEIVVQVIIQPPLQHIKEQDARRYITTKVDRPFDERTVQEDVRRMSKSNLFKFVADPTYQRVGENGIIVTYHVVENPTIKYLKFYGNTVRERHLKKQSGLKVGDPWEPYLVEEARTKVQDYYHEKGFNKAKVTTIEGNHKDDRGVVFLVNEGKKQKVRKVEFVGNSIASDGRLKTQIQSKPPLFYLFKGEVDRQKIEDDVGHLYNYYRNLGFFRAKIARELVFDPDQSWLTIRFIIDEGPRYKVNNIKFVGQRLFSADDLSLNLKLKPGDFFDQSKQEKDRVAIQDKYGIKGYVFATIQPEPKFSENPDEFDQLDIVYQIDEGRPCIVSRVDVKISGDNPHTRRNTILNRVSLHPGDLLSTRELRDSERRLKASSLFKNTPGDEPKIEFTKPNLNDVEGLAEKPSGTGGFRGQSPDPRRGAP